MSDAIPPPIATSTLSYHSPLAQNASAVWRDGYLLVATKEARFPERCIKCNAPASYFLRRKLSWHNPLIYLVLLANILIYAIIAMVVQKKGTLFIALCENHRKSRLMLITVAWVLFVLSIVAGVAGIALESALFGILIPILIIAAVVVGLIGSRVVTVDHIDERFIYLKNVNKDFLLTLPGYAPSNSDIDQIVVQQLQQHP